MFLNAMLLAALIYGVVNCRKIFLEGQLTHDDVIEGALFIMSYKNEISARALSAQSDVILNDLLVKSNVDEEIGDASMWALSYERHFNVRRMEAYRSIDLNYYFQRTNLDLDSNAKHRIEMIAGRLKTTGSIYRNFKGN